eukprot:gene27522-33244_t
MEGDVDWTKEVIMLHLADCVQENSLSSNPAIPLYREYLIARKALWDDYRESNANCLNAAELLAPLEERLKTILAIAKDREQLESTALGRGSKLLKRMSQGLATTALVAGIATAVVPVAAPATGSACVLAALASSVAQRIGCELAALNQSLASTKAIIAQAQVDMQRQTAEQQEGMRSARRAQLVPLERRLQSLCQAVVEVDRVRVLQLAARLPQRMWAESAWLQWAGEVVAAQKRRSIAENAGGEGQDNSNNDDDHREESAEEAALRLLASLDREWAVEQAERLFWRAFVQGSRRQATDVLRARSRHAKIAQLLQSHRQARRSEMQQQICRASAVEQALSQQLAAEGELAAAVEQRGAAVCEEDMAVHVRRLARMEQHTRQLAGVRRELEDLHRRLDELSEGASGGGDCGGGIFSEDDLLLQLAQTRQSAGEEAVARHWQCGGMDCVLPEDETEVFRREDAARGGEDADIVQPAFLRAELAARGRQVRHRILALVAEQTQAMDQEEKQGKAERGDVGNPAAAAATGAAEVDEQAAQPPGALQEREDNGDGGNDKDATAAAELLQWSRAAARRLRSMPAKERQKSLDEQRWFTRLLLERAAKAAELLDEAARMSSQLSSLPAAPASTAGGETSSVASSVLKKAPSLFSASYAPSVMTSSSRPAFAPLLPKTIQQRLDDASAQKKKLTTAWESLMYLSEKMRGRRVPDLQFQSNAELTNAWRRADRAVLRMRHEEDAEQMEPKLRKELERMRSYGAHRNELQQLLGELTDFAKQDIVESQELRAKEGRLCEILCMLDIDLSQASLERVSDKLRETYESAWQRWTLVKKQVKEQSNRFDELFRGEDGAVCIPEREAVDGYHFQGLDRELEQCVGSGNQVLSAEALEQYMQAARQQAVEDAVANKLGTEQEWDRRCECREDAWKTEKEKWLTGSAAVTSALEQLRQADQESRALFLAQKSRLDALEAVWTAGWHARVKRHWLNLQAAAAVYDRYPTLWLGMPAELRTDFIAIVQRQNAEFLQGGDQSKADEARELEAYARLSDSEQDILLSVLVTAQKAKRSLRNVESSRPLEAIRRDDKIRQWGLEETIACCSAISSCLLSESKGAAEQHYKQLNDLLPSLELADVSQTAACYWFQPAYNGKVAVISRCRLGLSRSMLLGSVSLCKAIILRLHAEVYRRKENHLLDAMQEPSADVSWQSLLADCMWSELAMFASSGFANKYNSIWSVTSADRAAFESYLMMLRSRAVTASGEAAWHVVEALRLLEMAASAAAEQQESTTHHGYDCLAACFYKAAQMHAWVCQAMLSGECNDTVAERCRQCLKIVLGGDLVDGGAVFSLQKAVYYYGMNGYGETGDMWYSAACLSMLQSSLVLVGEDALAEKFHVIADVYSRCDLASPGIAYISAFNIAKGKDLHPVHVALFNMFIKLQETIMLSVLQGASADSLLRLQGVSRLLCDFTRSSALYALVRASESSSDSSEFSSWIRHAEFIIEVLESDFESLYQDTPWVLLHSRYHVLFAIAAHSFSAGTNYSSYRDMLGEIVQYFSVFSLTPDLLQPYVALVCDSHANMAMVGGKERILMASRAALDMASEVLCMFEVSRLFNMAHECLSFADALYLADDAVSDRANELLVLRHQKEMKRHYALLTAARYQFSNHTLKVAVEEWCLDRKGAEG